MLFSFVFYISLSLCLLLLPSMPCDIRSCSRFLTHWAWNFISFPWEWEVRQLLVVSHSVSWSLNNVFFVRFHVSSSVGSKKGGNNSYSWDMPTRPWAFITHSHDFCDMIISSFCCCFWFLHFKPFVIFLLKIVEYRNWSMFSLLPWYPAGSHRFSWTRRPLERNSAIKTTRRQTVVVAMLVTMMATTLNTRQIQQLCHLWNWCHVMCVLVLSTQHICVLAGRPNRALIQAHTWLDIPQEYLCCTWACAAIQQASQPATCAGPPLTHWLVFCVAKLWHVLTDFHSNRLTTLIAFSFCYKE